MAGGGDSSQRQVDHEQTCIFLGNRHKHRNSTNTNRQTSQATRASDKAKGAALKITTERSLAHLCTCNLAANSLKTDMKYA